MNLFIVGHFPPDEDEKWEFVGVFNTKSEAESHCITNRHFIGPAELNEVTTHTVGTVWPDCYYPKGQDNA